MRWGLDWFGRLNWSNGEVRKRGIGSVERERSWRGDWDIDLDVLIEVWM